MLFLQHNHETSLQALAKTLSDELKLVQNYYNIEELRGINTDDMVVIAKTSLKEDLQALLMSLESSDVVSDSILPKIVIAKGTNIRTENGLTPYKREVVELVSDNPNDNNSQNPIILGGKWFSYEVDLQIVILTKSDYANIELQLELKRILNEKMKLIKYSLRVGDTQNPDVFMRCDDFGQVALYGFENAGFETQSDKDTGYKATYITGTMNEDYFKLTNLDIAKSYEINYLPN